MHQADPIEILDPETADQEEERVRARFWKTVKKAARQIPFMEDVVAAYYCALDPDTPARVRYTLLAALGYFVLPIDIVPDFIAGFGFGDDATVLMAAITTVGAHIRDVHRQVARAALADNDVEVEPSDKSDEPKA